MRTKIAMSFSSGFCQRMLLLTSLPRVIIDASMAAVVPVRSISIHSLGILSLASMGCMKKKKKRERDSYNPNIQTYRRVCVVEKV